MKKITNKDRKNDPFQKYNLDESIENNINKLADRFKISPTELLANFPIYARRVTLKRFLAYYELYRQTMELPGDIVELGGISWKHIDDVCQFS